MNEAVQTLLQVFTSVALILIGIIVPVFSILDDSFAGGTWELKPFQRLVLLITIAMSISSICFVMSYPHG